MTLYPMSDYSKNETPLIDQKWHNSSTAELLPDRRRGEGKRLMVQNDVGECNVRDSFMRIPSDAPGSLAPPYVGAATPLLSRLRFLAISFFSWVASSG